MVSNSGIKILLHSILEKLVKSLTKELIWCTKVSKMRKNFVKTTYFYVYCEVLKFNIRFQYLISISYFDTSQSLKRNFVKPTHFDKILSSYFYVNLTENLWFGIKNTILFLHTYSVWHLVVQILLKRNLFSKGFTWP